MLDAGYLAWLKGFTLTFIFSDLKLYCAVLCCTVLYCTVLYCMALGE